MRVRLGIAVAGVVIGLALRFIFTGGFFGEDPDEADKNQPHRGAPQNQKRADPDAVAALEGSLGGLVAPLDLGALSGNSGGEHPGFHASLVMTSLGDEFAHDADAHFHPHGHEVCASGCAASNHPTALMTVQEYRQLLFQYATEPLSGFGDDCPALETLLYFGRQTRELIQREGTGLLDSAHADYLQEELARTHARIEMRVIDENGEVRSWIDPTLVPLDRRHVFDMQVNGVQPLVTSGTVKRTGLHHLWTRL